MLTLKKEIAIRIFCLIILTGVCLAIYYHGKDLSCDDCAINFIQLRRGLSSSSNEVEKVFQVNINELHETFLEGKCVVKFDSLMGFYYHNGTNYFNQTE